LDSITTDLEAARQNAEAAELAKATADEELVETRVALEASQADKDKLQQDLGEAAKTIGAEQDALIEALRGQIKTLQHEFDKAQENLEALRAARANDSSIAAAAEIDRQALAKAKEDLETVEAEKATLKVAHDEALNSATEKISALELEASRAEALAAEVASLGSKKEETSTKLTELEVEIMESKEALELAEGELEKSKTQIEALRAEIAKLADEADSATQGATAKEKAAAEHLEEVQKQHADVLALAVEDSTKLTEQLRVLQAETDELRNNLEAANEMTASAVEEHARKLEEVEKVHQAQRGELIAEKERISAELEAQESVYNAKVQTVKDEHGQLLREAFERAKGEAGDAHAQDLQALRENSDGAIEQLRASHQATVEGLKVDHEAALASQAQTFQKQLSNQALELKATSEDLAKAKATINASLQQVESLTVQLDEARRAAQATASAADADQNAEIMRLNKELSNSRDELSGLNEVFRATQESMQEMSKNHQMELEDAGERRTEEASKLRAAHDAEIQSIVADRSNLVTRLSDLEGEVATLRAYATPTEAVASPKRNGPAPVPAETVTKEEMLGLHEAHNLKINDLQAQHDKAMRALQEQVDAAVTKADEMEQDLARKKMEIMYLEQDQEESQDHITRMKDDLEHLTAKLSSTA
jgi:chromosome segregation ATPase